ncbi:hypothetical protein [Micromonospora sp. CPCC 205556]|uniref:hypothetical protein n=1 Tax=Micromonospora sp. CPCC 205556 TaxID=3122398 RepID=UPI002FF1BE88
MIVRALTDQSVTWFFLEADAEGWVTRQVELGGPEQTHFRRHAGANGSGTAAGPPDVPGRVTVPVGRTASN